MEVIHAEKAGEVEHQVVVLVGHTHTLDGRLAWKQYMLKKPVKWSIKLWCMCDTHTYTRWEIGIEAIYAEETGEVGLQTVVLV